MWTLLREVVLHLWLFLLLMVETPLGIEKMTLLSPLYIKKADRLQVVCVCGVL